MPIEIRLYDNLFGSEGNIKPNQLPSPDKKQVVPRQPTMYDFANGYIKLYGVGNYAIYKGKHYFLEVVKRYDEDKQSYGYAMRLDYGMEALYRRPTLTGSLNVSNNDELLEKHLQYTQPTLVDPTEATRLNFEEVEKKGYENLRKVPSTNPLTQPVITHTNGDYFIKSHTHGYAKQYIEDWRDKYFNFAKTDAIYIFSYLKGDSTAAGWKNLLRKRVNEFLASIGENQKIAKVVTPEGSALVGKYCITDKQGGIGGGEENVSLDAIDLSGLKDIQEVRTTDLQVDFLSFVEFSEETAVVPDIDLPVVDVHFGLKLCRKFYGSFTGTNDNSPYRGTGLGSGVIDNSHYLYFGENALISSSGDYVRDASVGDLSSSVGRRVSATKRSYTSGGSLQSTQFLTFKTEAAGVEEHVNLGITYGVDRINFEISGEREIRGLAEKYHRPNYLTLPYPRIDNQPNDSEYYFTKMDNPPGFGFLIYQTIRPGSSGNTIEYTGTAPLRHLDVIIGIKDSFNRDYRWLPGFPVITDNSEVKLGNMGVLLFYLDLYSFLYFVPSYESGGYQYRYGDAIKALGMDTLITEQLTGYTNHDVTKNVRLDGKDYKPFSNTEYPKFAIRRENILRDVTIQEPLNLEQEGAFGQLNQGDYFFTDLEYGLSDIELRVPTRPNDIVGGASGRTGETVYATARGTGDFDSIPGRRSIGVVSDFVEREGDNNPTYFRKLNESGIVLCSTKERELEIRSFRSFKKNHNLSRDRNQVLYTVNKSQSQEVTYSKLGNLGIKLKTNEPIPVDVRIKILEEFYKHHNYKFHDGKWSGVPESEIKNSSHDRIFDLVGTEGYCHIKGTKISLISKSETIFKKTNYKTSKIKIIDKLKNLTLLEKINQRCYLTVHTQTRPIKSKFNFSENSFFNVEVTSAKPTRLQTGENHYIIHARNKFDVIDREIISIPKIPEDAVDIATSAQIQQQRLIQLRAEQDYAIAAGMLDIREDRVNENLRRSNGEVMMRKIDYGLNVPQAIFKGAINLSQFGTNIGRFAELAEMGETPTARHGRKAINLLGLTPANAASFIYGNFIEEPMRGSESYRRASFEQEVGIREVNLERSRIDYRAERAKQDSFIQINSLSNMHRRGLVNDAHLIREINKTKEFNDGQEMNDIHLVIYTPSKDQLSYLIPHKERHGVDCNIPNQTYEFFPGMPEDVMRFKDLYTENVKELDNFEIRKKFLEMVITGIKIVDAKSEIHIEAKTEAELLRHDLEVEVAENRRLTDQNSDLVQELDEVSVKYDEEKDKTKNLTSQNQQLSTEKQKLQTDLTSATNRADTLSASVHRLEGELTQEKNVKNLLQAEVNQMRPKVQELTTVKNENTRLTNQIIDLGTKVHNLTNQIAALTDQKITGTYQGDPETGNVTLNQSLSNLNNQIEALNKYSAAIKQDKVSQVQSGLCFESEHYRDCYTKLSYVYDTFKGIIEKGKREIIEVKGEKYPLFKMYKRSTGGDNEALPYAAGNEFGRFIKAFCCQRDDNEFTLNALSRFKQVFDVVNEEPDAAEFVTAYEEFKNHNAYGSIKPKTGAPYQFWDNKTSMVFKEVITIPVSLELAFEHLKLLDKVVDEIAKLRKTLILKGKNISVIDSKIFGTEGLFSSRSENFFNFSMRYVWGGGRGLVYGFKANNLEMNIYSFPFGKRNPKGYE